jgi:hypothetical protein
MLFALVARFLHHILRRARDEVRIAELLDDACNLIAGFLNAMVSCGRTIDQNRRSASVWWRRSSRAKVFDMHKAPFFRGVSCRWCSGNEEFVTAYQEASPHPPRRYRGGAPSPAIAEEGQSDFRVPATVIALLPQRGRRWRAAQAACRMRALTSSTAPHPPRRYRGGAPSPAIAEEGQSGVRLAPNVIALLPRSGRRWQAPPQGGD